MVHIALVGVTTVIFGIASLLLISRARKRLSDGSIRRYMDNFAICLAFIVIFSVWQTTRSILGISINVEGLATYPEYIFIVLAYLAFIIASFRVLKISEEFGFKEDGKKIGQLIREKPSKVRAGYLLKHAREHKQFLAPSSGKKTKK
ncbi:MAG: hypothetical protein Q8R04_04190 [Nanoarchaeota archaeon]|nr:hypothetical protein [Nanoarchaeota archaeon]